MAQDVLVIHGAGEPRRRGKQVYWKPMLSASLGRPFKVQAPRMPKPDDPQHAAWSRRIAKLVSDLKHPILVGHSFGASTLLKYFAETKSPPDFAGLFLVSTPFWGKDFPDFALSTEQLKRLKTVKPLFFYQSKDDDTVEVSHFRKFRKALPQATFRLLDDRGHEFDQDTFPELAKDIRSLTVD